MFVKQNDIQNQRVRRGFHLINDGSEVRLIAMEVSFEGSILNINSNRELLGYRILDLDPINSSLKDGSLMSLTTKDFNNPDQWNKCWYKKVEKEKDILPLVYQKILDVRKSGNNFIVVSFAEYSTNNGSPEHMNRADYNVSHHDYSDFIVSSISNDFTTRNWSYKTPYRFGICDESLPQLYEIYPFFSDRQKSNTKECAIVGNDSTLFIVYSDFKEYLKPCFEGDVKIAKNEDPAPATATSLGSKKKVGHLLKIDLQTGEAKDDFLFSVFPQGDTKCESRARYSATRIENDKLIILLQGSMYFLKGTSQEVKFKI